MTKRILNRKEVEQTTALTRSTIYARMKEGTFPQSIPLGGRRVGWLESDIQEWIEQQISSKDAA
ncbi:helix-turn-helix transcriptional regulator [Oceanospirillum linum]|uniref:DNA-binding protein n=1 Tax=Oceanospirillum linum TaxID=966 RepID=A0A1T1H8M9_OCELI|nr:AlpA family transcriptional regulator [Oceanospirillum linum]OOV86203.1 DNA-binding protein [Oceanospirillum linum]SEG38303.1 transcriptional regulator, AlpA family [Oleiphilus messinensis]SMP32152.1 transcriptional regulator, AlpA family [Oceanospirillum linum]